MSISMSLRVNVISVTNNYIGVSVMYLFRVILFSLKYNVNLIDPCDFYKMFKFRWNVNDWICTGLTVSAWFFIARFFSHTFCVFTIFNLCVSLLQCVSIWVRAPTRCRIYFPRKFQSYTVNNVIVSIHKMLLNCTDIHKFIYIYTIIQCQSQWV